MKQKTWRIFITGQVQGVGFRPFIYRIAKKFSLCGWVGNYTDGVHIEFNADEVAAKLFYGHILKHAPPLSHIVSHNMKQVADTFFEDFKIADSNTLLTPKLLLSPDFAMCATCRNEVLDKHNRRHNYAFTTCTQCGPRYSIITQLPYDRNHTSMHGFTMCKDCKAEYFNPDDRRYFSQTNSCPQCPVIMKLFDSNKNVVEQHQKNILSAVCELWRSGKIVAIKSIGGYLLTCDAENANAIQQLRIRKHRPFKPFALMYPGLQLLQQDVITSDCEVTELTGAVAPVVLLQVKSKRKTGIVLPQIAPGLSRIGVMLPSTPMFELLLQEFSKPIIATSGNISNAPVIFNDDDAVNELTTMADYVLVHDREIISQQDDSVVMFSTYTQQRILLRRSRGFAPLYCKNVRLSEKTVLATGALLKSSFTLLHHQNIHISQYLGDCDQYDAQKNYQHALQNILQIFQTGAGVVVADLHPDYFTSQLAKQLSEKWNSQLVPVQHHKAHFASVLAEHNLFDISNPVLGIIWDGMGFGEDGNIWGGEFFLYETKSFSRVQHFEYFDYFLGDKMALEPRLSAFALCMQNAEAVTILESKFSAIEWKNYHRLIEKNSLKTSSAGRLFDAVASLLGLTDVSSYEGEAAMLLEEEALKYFNTELTVPDSWLQLHDDLFRSTWLINSVVNKISGKINTNEIAAWFHVQLVLAVQKAAQLYACQTICFSGGVFQNGLLIDLLKNLLGTEYNLYFNKNLSPNDENISFGQLMWWNNINCSSAK